MDITIGMKTGLSLLMLANALLALPMAMLVRRDFKRLGRVSGLVAIWTGIAMHGHAIATLMIAWIDRGSLYGLSAWSLAPGIALILLGGFVIYLGRKAYGDRSRVYGLKEDELIEQGIYRRSRNPQYLGYGTMFLGAAIASGSALAFGFAAVFAALIHVYITSIEEPHLRRIFGADYRQYTARVGRYFRFGQL